MQPKSLLLGASAFLLSATAAWAVDHQTFTIGNLSMTGPSVICDLDEGVSFHIAVDGNLAIFNGPTLNDVVWASGASHQPSCNGNCKVHFLPDGNLATFYGDTALWSSNTPSGVTMTCATTPPYLMIFDSSGTLVWNPVNNKRPWNVLMHKYFTDQQCLEWAGLEPWQCVH